MLLRLINGFKCWQPDPPINYSPDHSSINDFLPESLISLEFGNGSNFFPILSSITSLWNLVTKKNFFFPHQSGYWISLQLILYQGKAAQGWLPSFHFPVFKIRWGLSYFQGVSNEALPPPSCCGILFAPHFFFFKILLRIHKITFNGFNQLINYSFVLKLIVPSGQLRSTKSWLLGPFDIMQFDWNFSFKSIKISLAHII